jgi:hypothetical protein
MTLRSGDHSPESAWRGGTFDQVYVSSTNQSIQTSSDNQERCIARLAKENQVRLATLYSHAFHLL